MARSKHSHLNAMYHGALTHIFSPRARRLLPSGVHVSAGPPAGPSERRAVIRHGVTVLGHGRDVDTPVCIMLCLGTLRDWRARIPYVGSIV
eukprot:2360555-Rhodomonas_salina.2